MGSSPTGLLSYGYDLGGPEAGWKLKNADKHGYCEFSWLPDAGYWHDKAEEILLARVAGFTEENPKNWNADYFARHRAAEDQLKVKIVTYGSYDYPGYILAVKRLSFSAPAWDSGVVKIFTDNQASADLDKALRALELVPQQSEPEWILASIYS